MKKKIAIFMIMSFCSALTATAQENSSTENNENKITEEETIGRIVVTADRIKRSTQKTWLPTSVVDSNQIEEKSYSSLSEVLESTPGFSRVYDYHSPLILRGTSGTKMLILRNGNPRFSSFPGGFMGQSVNVYDLDRVEVVRGPGSVIYGSGATCGVINMIDRDVFDEEKDLGFKTGVLYGSNSNDRALMAGANFRTDHLAMRVTGKYNKSDNYHYADNEEALNSSHEEKDASLNGGLRFNENNRITFRGAVHFGGPWGKAYGFNNKEQMMARNEDDNMLDLSIKYEGNSVGIFDKVMISGFYARETREYHKMKMNSTLTKINFEDITDYKNIYYGGNAMATVKAGINYVSIGADSNTVKLWSPTRTVDHYNYAEPAVISEIDGSQGAGMISGGIFVQDNITVSQSLSITAGMRYDAARIFQGDRDDGDEELKSTRDAVSGNLGMVFAPVKNHALSLNLGRAFRMPDAVDMFNEQVTCQGTIVPNTELEPEYSWNIDTGYRGRAGGLEWNISLFINQYSQLIVKGTNPDDSTEQMMMNEDNARIMGGELETSFIFQDIASTGIHVKPGITAAYCRGSSFADDGEQWDFSDEGEALTGIPPANIKPYVRFMFMSDSGSSCFLLVECDTWLKKTRLSEDEGSAAWNNEDVDGYMLLNISMGMSLSCFGAMEKIKVNMACNNLMDKRYYPFGSHIPGKGRDIRAFTSLEF